MDDVKRITPAETAKLVDSGQALLICAYEDEKTYASMNLKGSISIHEFRERRGSLAKDKTLIFYCA